MKLRSKTVLKIVTGILLVVMAAGVTVIMKSALMSRTPEYALPVVQVMYNGTGLPYENQDMAAYTWSFLGNVKKSSPATAENWRNLPAAWVNPGTALRIDFSFEPDEILIHRADNGDGTFVELGGELRAPLEEGEYTYRVNASWGNNKNILYYFRIRVPSW